jgi:DNA-binding transcriptional MerR regulator
VTALLSIGEFATITHLGVKTLRHYHETELLAPDQVDAHSGYRYYTTDQIPSAQIIRRFRDLDMPVRDIARLLSADVDDRAALISDHLARLERRLAATTEAVRTGPVQLGGEPQQLGIGQVAHRPARAAGANSQRLQAAR